ncbi:MAG TPA: TetR/AcrR family transcriptional regulator [Bryobacteraceae bacterium]|nr:TetR/AcrR family transcriptional regulator [Bryobacteraceae bacterium]
MMNCVTVDTVSGAAMIRSLVLAAVHDEIVERGYREMTMSSLAARAGVNEEALRKVFVSKESVLVAHLDRLGESMIALLSGIARAKEPVPARVREFLLTRVLFRFDMLRPWRAHLEHMREALLLALRRRGPVYVENEARILERLLAEGQRAGVLFWADPEPMARTLLVATSALLPNESNLTALPPAGDLRRTAAHLIDVVLEGAMRGNWTPPSRESPRIDATAL